MASRRGKAAIEESNLAGSLGRRSLESDGLTRRGFSLDLAWRRPLRFRFSSSIGMAVRSWRSGESRKGQEPLESPETLNLGSIPSIFIINFIRHASFFL